MYRPNLQMIRSTGWKWLVAASFLLAFTSTSAQRKPELHPQELFLEECADTASATAVTVDNCNRITFTGSTTIDTINTCSAATDGRVLHIVCGAGAMMFGDAADNLLLDGNFTCAGDSTMTIICDGTTTDWNELARSPAAGGGTGEVLSLESGGRITPSTGSGQAIND